MKYFLLTAFFLGNAGLLSHVHAMDNDETVTSSLSTRHTAKRKIKGDAFINRLKTLVAQRSRPGETVSISFSPSTGVLVVTTDESLVGFNFLPVLPEGKKPLVSKDNK